MELEMAVEKRARQAPSLSDRSCMDVVVIHALLDSLFTIFSTMVGLRILPGIPEPKTDNEAKGVVTGLLSMNAGDARGSVALSLTLPAVRLISQGLMNHEIVAADDEAADLAGELVNMLVGGAKRTLSEQGHEFDMQIPELLQGEGHHIEHPYPGQTIVLPVAILGQEAGFYIELNFV